MGARAPGGEARLRGGNWGTLFQSLFFEAERSRNRQAQQGMESEQIRGITGGRLDGRDGESTTHELSDSIH